MNKLSVYLDTTIPIKGEIYMILDELLREQHRVQKELSEAAGDDVDQYFQLIHRLALETQQQYGLTFKYGVPAGFVPPAASLLPASPRSI